MCDVGFTIDMTAIAGIIFGLYPFVIYLAMRILYYKTTVENHKLLQVHRL